MFWDEEKIEDAHRIGRFLGPWGRMLEDRFNRLTNICLYTKEHGKVWYGDVNLDDDKSMLQLMARALEQTIYIIPDSPREGYDKPMHESAWAVVEVKE
jgi:hypothetical protein